MNTINSSTNNFLLAYSTWNRNMEVIMNFCIKQAEKSKITLLLSSKPLQHLQSLKNFEKHNLSRIIIMYFDDIDKYISKLLELHIWPVIPSIVILDVDQFFCGQPKNPPTHQKICLLISALLNYMKYLENIKNHISISFVLMNVNSISENLIKTIVDLYYYRSAYSDIENLINVLPIIE